MSTQSTIAVHTQQSSVKRRMTRTMRPITNARTHTTTNVSRECLKLPIDCPMSAFAFWAALWMAWPVKASAAARPILSAADWAISKTHSWLLAASSCVSMPGKGTQKLASYGQTACGNASKAMCPIVSLMLAGPSVLNACHGA